MVSAMGPDVVVSVAALVRTLTLIQAREIAKDVLGPVAVRIVGEVERIRLSGDTWCLCGLPICLTAFGRKRRRHNVAV